MSRGFPEGAGGLLEREQSVSALTELLAEVVASSAGRLVLVSGEAGVGKSALLRRFSEAQSPPVRILWGACEPLRTPRPLGPVQDVAETTGGELEALVAGAARPYEVAMALLRELGRRAPTVVVLEDIHWADEATLDVLTLLAGRIGSVRALALATYRDDELHAAHPLRIALGELSPRPARLRLEPLTPAAVTELADHYRMDGNELFRATAGNPFFVMEVLAAGGAHMPETVRDAVLARAARLSEPARRLLEVVAVTPGQVDFGLLEVLAGALIDRVDECVAAGVLSASRAHLAFRHELARRAIEEAIAPHRRLALHRAALAALVDRDGDFARLAHHADAAGDAPAVLRWAPRAAERAALAGAHREAAAQYARALEFAAPLSLEERADLLQRRAYECFLTDQLDAAIATQREALECLRQSGDRLSEGDALRRLARLLSFANRHPESIPLSLAAVELLEQLPPGRELAMAYALVAEDQFVYHRVEEAVRWGTRALELATSIEDVEAQLLALEAMGAAQFQAGIDEGRVKLERALALAEEQRLDDYAGRAFVLLVRCCVRLRQPRRALSYIDAGLEYCTQRGLDTWRLYLLAGRARVELNLGRLDDATASASLALGERRSAPVVRVYASVVLGLARARRGDPDAVAPLEEAHRSVHATGQLEWITLVAAARAEAAWLRGEHAQVVPMTDAPLALALECREPWSTSELAYWRWCVGVRDELPGGTAGDPYRLSIAGEWRNAAEVWTEIGCPYEAALALAAGDEATALRRAHDDLQRLGARAAVAIVARRLRERGVRGLPRGPRARTRENPAGLTARELEVLALVAEGLRNAEIAQRLVLSEKTVDHHVSALLRKLEVRTRGEAGAEAVRLGIGRYR